MRQITTWAGILLATAICTVTQAQDDDPQESVKTTHQEAAPIEVELGPGGKLDTIAMDPQGRLLAAVSWPDPKAPARGGQNDFRRQPGQRPSGPRPPQRRPGQQRPGQQRPGRPGLLGDSGPRLGAIRVIDPRGRQVDSWDLGSRLAKMVHCCGDGTLYIGAEGHLTQLDATGKVRKSLDLAETLDGQYADAHVSGLTADEQYLFVAFGKDFSLRATEDIVRMKRDFTDAQVIITQQFGCCAHIDLDVKGDELLVAENSRHRVNRFTLDGELIERWGRRDRTGIEGFAACCNPVNIDLASDGSLVTAESGIGRIKRYSPEGEFLGMIGYVDTTKFDRGSRLAAMSCYIPVEISPDGTRVYVMDVRANFIRVLEANSP